MAHMVIFQGADGVPGYQQCETIEDCVKFVEELRNDRGVERARIFRMEEVDFEFRPYWFVVQRPALGASATPANEVPAAAGVAITPSDESATPMIASTPEIADDEPEAEAVDDSPAVESEGRDSSVSPPPPLTGRGLFGRS